MPMKGRTLSLVTAALLLDNSCEGSLLGGGGSGSAPAAIGAIYRTMEEAFSKGDLDTIAQVARRGIFNWDIPPRQP